MKYVIAIGIFLLVSVGMVVYNGVHVEHKVDMKSGKQKIKLPAQDEWFEIQRQNGKPPIKIKRSVPEREIWIDNNGSPLK